MEALNQFEDEVESPMKILVLQATVKLLLNLEFDVTFKRPVIFASPNIFNDCDEARTLIEPENYRMYQIDHLRIQIVLEIIIHLHKLHYHEKIRITSHINIIDK